LNTTIVSAAAASQLSIEPSPNWQDYPNTPQRFATVAVGAQPPLGEGQLSRVAPNGVTTISATSQGLTGSAPVRILEYYYRELQIFVRTPQVVRLDSLLMNTNLDTLLYVMGRRSNNAFVWDTISAEWQVSTSLQHTIAGAANAAQLAVSPTDTDSGWIRVTLGDDSRTLPDTLPVVFTPGPATQVRRAG